MDATKASHQDTSGPNNDKLIKDAAVTTSSNSTTSSSSITDGSPMKSENTSSIVPSDPTRSIVRLGRSNITSNPHSQGRGEIKSVVRVKHPTLDFSPLLALLQPHTDLNKPPPNWLRRRPPLRQQPPRQFFWPKRVSR